MTHATLVPAYGRDYCSKQSVVRGFEDGNDFILCDLSSRWDGKPCNRASLIQEGSYRDIKLRYYRLTRETMLRLPSSPVVKS